MTKISNWTDDEFNPQSRFDNADSFEHEFWKKKPLKELSKDESELIANLYLVENPLTEKAYAEYLRVSQQAINKKKLIVLEKLRKIF